MLCVWAIRLLLTLLTHFFKAELEFNAWFWNQSNSNIQLLRCHHCELETLLQNNSITSDSRLPLITHTHTHPFNGPLSGTTRVSRYQKGETDLDFTEARDSEWQWHQLGCMQVCTSLQTDNHASTPPLSFFTGWMPFLPPYQQRQSTEISRYAGIDM